MAKLTKDELIAKVNERVTDNEIAVELMEDITDSFEAPDDSKLIELQAKYDELLNRYKERFMSVEEVKEEMKDDIEESVEVKEDEVIDIQEI